VHPILQSRIRVGIYFGAWVPLTAILVVILVVRGDIPLHQGLFIGIPLGAACALLGIPIYYVCRANPLRGPQLTRSVLAHVVAALVYGLLWQITAAYVAVAVETILPAREAAGLTGQVRDLLLLWFALGTLFYLLTAASYYLILAGEASRVSERRQASLRVEAQGAELRALKAQINPHFLFNSLHTISSLTMTDPRQARETCIRLADFLRSSIGLGDVAVIPLRQELALTEHYLAVEAVRLGDRLRIRKTVAPGAERVLVPPLLLQPLVENAILHGVATLTEGGTLDLEVQVTPGGVRITVGNPFDPHAPARPGSGVGLDNVRRRLAAQYGGRATLDTNRSENSFRVDLTIPFHGRDEA
jgi:two-component system sensor histidine kinase AlgZ